ncbi:MAG: amino acid adenylation domain-containing protein [Rhodobacteraceae bacterium]|nr:amino acid adenylation domain-containing protein [Paracoccaceae bacterium]PHR62283.1 MAG: hypothetical protein COA47_04740 [Robiginitomaculum sp.]
MSAAATIPVTQSQSLIHMGQALAGEAPLYNMAWRFDLHLQLDPARFARAFTDMVQANDAMQTVFTGSGSGLIQSLRSDLPAFPPMLDFSAEPDVEAAVAAWVAKRATRPIDLACGSYDTCLLKLGSDHWVWFFCQHHITTDAWSGALLFKEVSDNYQGITAQTSPKFADYAARETALHNSAKLKPARDYWQAKSLDHVPNSAPYIGIRNQAKSASRRVSIPFGAARSAALRTLAHQPPFRSISADLSTFALLATLYAAFLHRVTGDRQITLGAPSHNRATPDLKATVGLFIEMYPLAVEIDESDTFETLYARILIEVMGYLRHAKPGASSAATANLFHAVLNYIPVDYGLFAGAKTQIEWLHPGAHDPGHDLRLHVYDFGNTGCFTVEADLNLAVFDREKAAAFPEHILCLFDALLQGPTQIISHIPLLPAPAALEGMHTEISHKTILSAINAQVRATPDAVAITSPSGSLTYAQLDTASDRLAATITPKMPVLIFATRSEALVTCILAALKAGAPFVPLAADTPPERVKTIANKLGPSCICLDAQTIDLATDLDLPILKLDSAPQTDVPTLPPPAATDPAYVIFTSGSSGTPKGVAVDHQNLAEYVQWAAQNFGPTGAKTYPLYSSIGFDLTLTSLFVPLITGGKIVVYPDAAHGPDLAILDVIADDLVDVIKLTPAHLALVLKTKATPKRIKTLVLGGENLTTEICRHTLRKFGNDIEIINEYGPTEAVVGCMIHRFTPGTDIGASVPIGKAADNIRIHILDSGLNPVPTGIIGEIYIEGRLANGYFKRADLTAERFITHPITKVRLYKSGDLARRDEQANIHYLGRADTQMKIGGIRMEPAEIEAALKAIPTITTAFVTTFQRRLYDPKQAQNSCTRCGITDSVPGTKITNGICNICAGFETYKHRAAAYFKTPEALQNLVKTLPARKSGKYDAIVLLSGGKDSTYALYRFAALTSNILTLTLDNGYISPEAKANITRVTDDLGVDHRFLTTPAMNAIFADSLTRHSNVCQGCFKTIYTLALRVARDEGIPAIVTGLSRGQFFETRLTPELFENRTPTVDELENLVLDLRKAYHRTEDAITQHLKTQDLQNGKIFDDVEIIDIYRYIDVPVGEIYDFLTQKAPWIRPGDTGRSTNCLINDAGIYVHLRREGFHNYALPYSWDVRMGHKTRAEAVDELQDAIDPSNVQNILNEVGFHEPLTDNRPELVAYITGNAPDEAEIRAHLGRTLPRAMVPAHIIRLSELPLNSNGKVDTTALPAPDIHHRHKAYGQVAPEGETESQLLAVFRSVIGSDKIGVTDNFYDIGGDSIAAIQIAIEASDNGLPLAANAVFEHQTIRALAENLVPATNKPANKPTTDDAPLISLGEADMAALARQLGGK